MQSTLVTLQQFSVENQPFSATR